MGGIDKGLTAFNRRPLFAPVLTALSPFAHNNTPIINCNRNEDSYGRYSNRICRDASPEFLGPLAGISSILKASAADLVVIAPCDTPFLTEAIPCMLLEKALSYLEQGHLPPPLAIHCDNHLHPTICCLPMSVLPSIDEALQRAHFKLGRWFKDVGGEPVYFDQIKTLTNLNTREELSLYSN